MLDDLELETYLTQQWKALPALTQQVIKEGTYHEVIQLALNKASVKNSEEYMDELTQEVLFVLLRLQAPEEFKDILKNIQVFTHEQIETIFGEISAQLFSPSLAENPAFEGNMLDHIFYVNSIQTAFRKLPQETQKTIQNLPLTCFDDIATEYTLNNTQRNILHKKVAKVIVGIKSTHNFVKEKRNELGIQHTDTIHITDTIEKAIFAPVRDSLLEAYTPKKTKEKVIEMNDKEGLEEVKGK